MCHRIRHFAWMIVAFGCLLGPFQPGIQQVDGSENIVADRWHAWKAWFARVSRNSEAPSDEQLLKRLPPITPSPLAKIGRVQQIAYDEPVNWEGSSEAVELIASSEPLPADLSPIVDRDSCPIPIDLSNALAMGGASHLEIQIARQRLIEAQAKLTEAQALWLPSLRFGVGWNKHDGRLQETGGNVLEINRNSFFVGGGAGLGSSPVTAGAGGPPRMFVNLSLSDAFFAKRSAAWNVDAASSNATATANRALLNIAVTYFDLLEAHGQLANARLGMECAENMFGLVSAFEKQGAGSQVEVDRAQTETTFWRQEVDEAERRAKNHSINLMRLLRLNPNGELIPAEGKVLPIHLVDSAKRTDELITEGLANRPEVAQQQALVQAAAFRVQQEHWRPWLPYVQAGTSAGSFGGGPSSTFDNQGSRSDIDLLAVWELQNVGLGNYAAYHQRRAQLRGAQLTTEWIRDLVVAEITTSANDVASYRKQMSSALDRVNAASESYQLNLLRIKSGEGLPIELLQAIRARISALDAYTKSVANYNRAQYQLLQNVGQPPYAVETPE